MERKLTCLSLTLQSLQCLYLAIMRRKDRKVSTYQLFTMFLIEFNEIVKIYDQRFEEKSSDTIKVVIRMRPPNKMELASEDQAYVCPNEMENSLFTTSAESAPKHYHFDHVFGCESTQVNFFI